MASSRRSGSLRTIRSLLAVDLPPASLMPAAIGFMTAIAVLIGFALPPLLQLARTPALRVLRRDVGPPPPLLLLAFGPAVAVVVFLVYWVVRDWKLFLGFTAGSPDSWSCWRSPGRCWYSSRGGCAAVWELPGGLVLRT